MIVAHEVRLLLGGEELDQVLDGGRLAGLAQEDHIQGDKVVVGHRVGKPVVAVGVANFVDTGRTDGEVRAGDLGLGQFVVAEERGKIPAGEVGRDEQLAVGEWRHLQ